jgi:hypothetical protein
MEPRFSLKKSWCPLAKPLPVFSCGLSESHSDSSKHIRARTRLWKDSRACRLLRNILGDLIFPNVQSLGSSITLGAACMLCISSTDLLPHRKSLQKSAPIRSRHREHLEMHSPDVLACDAPATHARMAALPLLALQRWSQVSSAKPHANRRSHLEGTPPHGSTSKGS